MFNEKVIEYELYKPIVSGIVATMLDRFYFGRENIKSNIGFGFAVGLGAGVSEVVNKYMPRENKELTGRVVDVSVSTISTFAIDRFTNISSNALNSRDVLPRVATIIVSDVIAEMARDYMY